MMLVWGRAQRVWWSPVIELIETRAEYYASVCPMMFFYGLPGVLGRMVSEAKLTVTHDETIDERMAFPSIDEAVRTGILGGALAGLYSNRLDDQQQRDVRQPPDGAPLRAGRDQRRRRPAPCGDQDRRRREEQVLAGYGRRVPVSMSARRMREWGVPVKNRLQVPALQEKASFPMPVSPVAV